MSKETSFVKNAEELAKQKMDAINPELSSKFKFLIKFLSQFPEACSKPRSKKMQNKVGQEEHIEYLARSFHESRLPRKPTPPTTVPDEVVSIVLNISFNIQPENLERIKEEHRFS
ncbi:type II site-specific deoxyribonuclease, partial [Bacillus thuringiensis Sbt003]